MEKVDKMIDYIIPTFNSAKTLALCIQSIKLFGNPKNIIIIDNNSTDSTFKIANNQGCLYVNHPGGIGQARRLGAQIATTDRIAFVDSDVELQASWQDVLESNAPIVSGYYEAFPYELPHIARGKAGFIACCIMNKQLILDCNEMDNWNYGEDSRFARWYAGPWLILNAECIHHRKNTASRWRKYGKAKRDIDGFSLVDLKRIIGGAAFGYRMGSARNYLENIWVRYNYLRGYIS